MSKVAGWLAIVVSAVAAFAACDSSSGTVAAPPDAGTEAAVPGSIDAAPSCGALAMNDAACTSCLRDGCCAELAACAGDSACASAFVCMDACPKGDESCRAKCVQTLPPTLANVLACRSNHCAAECNTTCGDVLGAMAPDFVASAPGCTACLEKNYCSTYTTCSHDPTCILADGCYDRSCVPGDYTCWTQCATPLGLLPSELQLLDPRTELAACAVECQTGANWSCAHHRPLHQSATSTELSLAGRLQDFQTGLYLPDAVVKTCGPGDLPCSAPIDIASTDRDGFFSLNTGPTNDTRVFNGYLDISGPNVFPTLELQFPSLWGNQIASSAVYVYYALLSTKTVDDLTELIGFTPDPARGMMQILVADCLQTLAHDVHISVSTADARTISVYGDATGVPSPTLTATSSSGVFVAFNVPAGVAKVVGTLISTGEVIASADVPVRAGASTAFTLIPIQP